MMTDNSKLIPADLNEGWKQKTILVGGVAGLVVGLLSAFLYIKSASQRADGKPPEAPGVGDAIRVGSVLLGVVRTVTEWANR